MIEEREPGRSHEPIRFEARVGGSGRSPVPALAVVMVLIGLAVAKPWQPSGPAGGVPRIAAEPRSPTPTSSRSGPSLRPAVPAAFAAVGDMCLEPGSWRTATIETWSGRKVRVWRALDPVPASGPTDPLIPVVPAVGTSVPAIGWCAPGSGDEAPSGALDVDAWRLDSGGASLIRLRQVDPVGVHSSFGALYGPPHRTKAAARPSWPDGVVVFRLAERQTGLERWFGIEVRGVSDGP
jgi:hypothetical protein